MKLVNVEIKKIAYVKVNDDGVFGFIDRWMHLDNSYSHGISYSTLMGRFLIDLYKQYGDYYHFEFPEVLSKFDYIKFVK